MKHFKVANVHCQNCANTIKSALEDEFGVIEVDLSREPKVVSVNLDDKDVSKFISELDDLGFEVIEQI